MSPKSYAELLEFIQKNNGWGPRMVNNLYQKKRRCFKYVTADFDTRTGRVWRIVLRNGLPEREKEFLINTPDDVYDLYEYLNTPCEAPGAAT